MPAVQPPFAPAPVRTPILENQPESKITERGPWGIFFSTWFAAIQANRLWNGSATFAGAGTVGVVFDEEQPNTSYFLALGPQANETFWIMAKTVNGFTLHSSNAASVATVDWTLSR